MSAPVKDNPVSCYILGHWCQCALSLPRLLLISSPQLKGSSGAESPTTVAPFEMDDDDIPESGNVPTTTNTTPMVPKPATVEDEAPPMPPRPLNPQQQAENTLKEAFPSIDAAVVKAVLMASGGRVEPAFNALLGKF